MRIVAFVLSDGTYCTALGQLNNCDMLISKVNKISVHISTVLHITEQKLCCTFICYCSLCDRLNLRKKQVCLRSPAVCADESVVEEGFSTNLHWTTECLKHSSNFESVENV